MTGTYWRFYLTNLSGFICYMSVGTIITYPSAAFPTMRFGREMEPLTLSMASWLASFSGLFAIPGSILVIPLMDKYGRKPVMVATPIVITIGWLLGVCAYDVATAAVSRAITGLGAGMEFGCVFVYITEISPKQQRGTLAGILSLTFAFGCILVTLLGNFIHWRWNTLVCLGVSLCSSVASFFIYETPRWLISKGQRATAMEIMRNLWLINEDQLKSETGDIEYNVSLVTSSTYFQILIQLVKPPLWKPLIISQLLIAVQQLIGGAYINTYTVQIFEEASLRKFGNHTDLIHFDNPYYQSTLVWVFFLIGAILSIFVIDRFGRRVLLIPNISLMTLSLVASGVYYYLKDFRSDIDLGDWHWIPVTSLIVYNFSSGAGIVSIPFLMSSEMFPLQSRSMASSLTMVTRNLLFFIVAKVFTASKLLPIFGIYWFFAGFGFLGLMLIVFIVPETKNRSLEEIQLQWYAEKTNRKLVIKTNNDFINN